MAKDFKHAMNKFGFEALNKWFNDYRDTVLGDGQDRDAYQEFQALGDYLPDKWDFVKSREGMSDEDIFNNFINSSYGKNLNYDEGSGNDDYDYDTEEYDFSKYDNAISKIHDAFGPSSENYDADNFLDRLTDFWNDNMSDGLRERSNFEGYDPDNDDEDKAWSQYVFKNTPWDTSKNTKIGSIAKSITQSDLGRSL